MTYRRPETAGTTRVTAEELAAFPRRNAEDALRQVPGFTVVQHGSEGKGHGARFSLPGTLRDEDLQRGAVGFYDAYDDHLRGLSARLLAAARYSVEHGPQRWSLVLYGGHRRLALLENYTGFLIDAEAGDRRRQEQVSSSAGVSARYRTQLVPELALSVGLGAHGDALDQGQTHVDQAERVRGVDRDLRGVQGLVHAFAGLDTRPLAWLRLHAGGRLDVAGVRVRDGENGDALGRDVLATLSPRVTARFGASHELRVLASYGRGFRPPEARAFTRFVPPRTGLSEDLFTGGEPTMTVADSAELGVRFQPVEYLGATLAGFASFIERETVFDHVSGINLELNGTRRLGVELGLRVDPYEWLSVRADATYANGRFIESGRPIPLAPELVGGLWAVLAHPSGLRAGLRLFGLSALSSILFELGPEARAQVDRQALGTGRARAVRRLRCRR